MLRHTPLRPISSIWKWLTRPSEKIVKAEHRRQAKLLLSLMSIIILIGPAAILLRLVTDESYTLPLIVIVGYALFFALYWLGRTIYFAISGYIVVYLIAFVNVSQPYFNQNTSLFPDGLAYLAISLVLSSIFTTKRNTILLSAFSILAIALLPLFNEGVSPQDVVSPVVFFLMTSLLLIIFLNYRDGLESDHQAEIIASEALYRGLYQEKSALLAATKTISASLKIDEVLQNIAKQLIDVSGVNKCVIAQWDRDSNMVTVKAVWPSGSAETVIDTNVNKNKIHPDLKNILETAQPVIIQNAQALDPQENSFLYLKNFENLLILPLYGGERVVGFIELGSNNRALDFDNNLIELCQGLTTYASIALDHAQLHQQLEEYAETLENRVSERTAALEINNQKLRRISSLKDEFVSNVSHELRTPITSIKLYNDLITRNPDKQKRYMDTLNREIERLSNLIEDLLRLSRLDQDRERLKSSQFDLNKLATSYVTDRQQMAHERQLTLTFNPHQVLPLANGDENLIGQVLSILLTNAFNYTPSGGRIDVATAASNGDSGIFVELSVRDTGKGILLEDQARLFDRFYRGQAGTESDVGGTGLGLAIAKEIVSLHDGEILLESEGIPGKGSQFVVRLPVDS